MSYQKTVKTKTCRLSIPPNLYKKVIMKQAEMMGEEDGSKPTIPDAILKIIEESKV